jgi:hypothetical protein
MRPLKGSRIGNVDVDIAFQTIANKLGDACDWEELKKETLEDDPDHPSKKMILNRNYLWILSQLNVDQWSSEKPQKGDQPVVEVRASDWGEVTLDLTQKYGEIFVVLNMANAEIGGGGYVEGQPAQEENIFRRSDCHFHLYKDEMLKSEEIHKNDPPAVQKNEESYYGDLYRPEFTKLLEGRFEKDAAAGPWKDFDPKNPLRAIQRICWLNSRSSWTTCIHAFASEDRKNALSLILATICCPKT